MKTRTFRGVVFIGLALFSSRLLAECGEATSVNIQRPFAIQDGDSYTTIARPIQSGTLGGATAYNQLGVRVNERGTENEWGTFKNTGGRANNGDTFESRASAAANTTVAANVDSNNLDYNLVYDSISYSAPWMHLNFHGDRTPDCSGGNPCYEEDLISATDASSTTTCDYIRNHLDFAHGQYFGSLTSEASTYIMNDIPSAGNYNIRCVRLQDTNTSTPTIASRWVRMVTDSSASASYGYEESITRHCHK